MPPVSVKFAPRSQTLLCGLSHAGGEAVDEGRGRDCEAGLWSPLAGEGGGLCGHRMGLPGPQGCQRFNLRVCLLIWLHRLLAVPSGVQFPHQGWDGPLCWECRALAVGHQGSPRNALFRF